MRLPREEARPAVLRRQRAPDRRAAAGGVRRRRACECRPAATSRACAGPAASRCPPARASSRARRWWWRRAGSRSRSSARRTSATPRRAVRRRGHGDAARAGAAAHAGRGARLLRGARGASIRTETRCGAGTFRENVLFTHRGVCGPAMLQASSYWRPGEALEIDLLPDEDAAALLDETRAHGRGLVRMLERAPAAPLRAGLGGAPCAGSPARGAAQARAGGAGRAPARLAARAERHRGLRQGRGHGRRRGHARAVVAHDRMPARARPLLHRRGRGRDRLARRVQLPVGLGVGLRRRAGRVEEERPAPLSRRCRRRRR